MQFAYYAGLTLCVIIVNLVFGLRPHTAQLFSSIIFSDSTGKYWFPSILAYWVNVPLSVLAHAFVVEKARKCLDFTATIVIIHIFLVWILWGWPREYTFWFHQFLWLAVTCLLSESLCMKLETQEIKLSINDLLDQSALKAK